MSDKTADRLVEISDRLGNCKDSDAQDIDWLLGQVAMLRQQNRILQTNITALEKQLADAQDIVVALYLRLGVQNE